MERWREIATEIPASAPAIMAGLQKLNSYLDQAQEVPAYSVAMGKS
jgi:hypothetical protein